MTQRQPVRTSFSCPLLLVLLCTGGVLLGGMFLRIFVSPVQHDQISYLIEGARVLSGDQLYGPHLAESNPPMIIWFSVLPVLLGGKTHALQMLCFRILVLSILSASLAWSVQILRRGKVFTNNVSLTLFALAIALVYLEPLDFGQREHLLVLFLLPYVLAVGTGAAARLSTLERCALGISASIGLWFKPQHALIVIALAALLIVCTRTMRSLLSPEFLAMVAGNFVILGIAFAVAPLYFTRTIPILRDVYWGLGTADPVTLISGLHIYDVLAAGMLLLWFLVRRRLRNPRSLLSLLVCSYAALVAFAIQDNSWTYHQYPYKTLMELAIAYLVADISQSWVERVAADPHRCRVVAWWTAIGAAGFLLALAVKTEMFGLTAHQPQVPADRLFAQTKPGTMVYVFSSGVPAMAMAYRHELQWGGRYAHLWMMPAIVQNELGPTGPPAPFKKLPRERLATLSAIQREASAEDLNYWKPALVLVEQCRITDPCQAIEGKNFDMLAWFLQSPQFATEWSRYRKLPSVEHFDVYARAP